MEREIRMPEAMDTPNKLEALTTGPPHQHLCHLTTDILKTERTDMFMLYSHPVENLACNVVYFAKLTFPDKTNRQILAARTAKSRFDFLALEHQRLGKLIDYGDVIRLYGKILDEMFFFGSLLEPRNERVVIEYVDIYYEDLNKPVFGYSLVNFVGACSKIVIYRADNQRVWRRNRLEMTVITILHEMVHVFLATFSCPACLPAWEGEGRSGHGKAFMDIMSVLPAAAVQNGIIPKWTLEMLDLEFDLGKELDASGSPMPDDETLRRWGLDRKVVEITQELRRKQLQLYQP
ncbi:hypothetical protein BJ875DRAFT_481008 [Amylocarpus encephaloides]|uniref:SprT-like domain-containing protein n=1 Tax=Amylocarpus encephaloides TaxID=45428 RepID=A0A9P8C8C4_9HELO|nr:hypothetical protein BJ875DRAFT_481008 [Amylocarpus encephaloides]